MRIHFFLHVPFEGAANVGAWARDRGHAVTGTRFFSGEPMPAMDSLDWLVVMGGLMNVYEHDAYPWLVDEKKFMEQAIERGKVVVGVCLGAQLAADVLGGRVERNRHREIGWFPLTLTEVGRRSPAFEGLAPQIDVFQWHGDTFSIPPGAENLAETAACTNQAFLYNNRVLGMQFHLDYSVESIELMLHHCADELTDGPFVQSAATIRAAHHRVATASGLLDRVLGNLEARWNGDGESLGASKD